LTTAGFLTSVTISCQFKIRFKIIPSRETATRPGMARSLYFKVRRNVAGRHGALCASGQVGYIDPPTIGLRYSTMIATIIMVAMEATMI